MKNNTGALFIFPMLVVGMIFFMVGYSRHEKMMMLLSGTLGAIAIGRLIMMNRKK
jgi:hypothetical protein